MYAAFFAFQPARFMCVALFCCPFSGGALIPLLRSPCPSGEAAGMETNKWRLTLDLASTVPRQLLLPKSRRLVLPVHLLCLAPLLGCIRPVAGDVKLEDDGVVHHPVDGRGGGHGVGKDTLPLGEDQV